MEQKIQIENNKRLKLMGLLNDSSSDTLIVLCHGYTASKDMEGFNHLTRSLIKNKVSTFRFDFSGSGESEGNKEMSLKQQVADIETVLEHFKKYQRIFLLGHSLGVLPVLMSSKVDSVTGIISINGFFQGKVYRKDFNRVYQLLRLLRFLVPRIANEWQFMVKNTNTKNITKPMLIITTKNDEIIDYRQSIKFGEQLNQSHSVEILSLSGHGINSVNDGKIIATLIKKWVDTIKPSEE